VSVLKQIQIKYISSFDEKLREFRNCIKNKSVFDARMFGHKLHGSGGSYGFGEISSIGKRINTFAHEENWTALEEEFKVLASYIAKYKKELNIS
jgi:hypothetical protein